jgi:kinesin family protein 20
MQLGIVIEELRNNQKNPGSVAVSFRNSKLTRLMQTYLTGNSKTSIIVAVSQATGLKFS